MQLIISKDGKALYDYGLVTIRLDDAPFLFSLYHSNKIEKIKSGDFELYFYEIDDIVYIASVPIKQLSIILHKYCVAIHRSFPNNVNDILQPIAPYFSNLRLYGQLEAINSHRLKDFESKIKYTNVNLAATLIFEDNDFTLPVLIAMYNMPSLKISTINITILQLLLTRREEGYKWIPIQLDTLFFVFIKKESNTFFVHLSDRHDRFDSMMLIHSKCLNQFKNPRFMNFKLDYSLFGLFVHKNQCLLVQNLSLLKLKYQKYNLRDQNYSFTQFQTNFHNIIITTMITQLLQLIHNTDRPLSVCHIQSLFDKELFCCTAWHHGDYLFLFSSVDKLKYVEQDKTSMLSQIEKKGLGYFSLNK